MSGPAAPTSLGVVPTAWAMAVRDVGRLIRVPRVLLFNALQPIVFFLLFAFVLGGAIRSPEARYSDFLVPGILVMGVIFSTAQTAGAAALEVASGVVDRLRSLPVSRLGLLGGRVLADLARTGVNLVLLLAVGVATGFRPGSWVGLVSAVPLLLAFGAAVSWGASAAGYHLRNIQLVQALAFVVILPLTFLSSVFVPPGTMPLPVRLIARVNPVSWVADATRGLASGDPELTTLALASGVVVGLIALLALLAVRAFDRL